MNITMTLPEADVIFRALKVVDPHNIFTADLQKRLADEARAEMDKEKK